MPEPVTLSAAEVAALLGIAPATFFAKVPAMRARHGFPARLPGSRRYSRAAVLAWIDGRGAPPASPGLAGDMAEAEATLIGRARKIQEAA